jgi:hypothetical protein
MTRPQIRIRHDICYKIGKNLIAVLEIWKLIDVYKFHKWRNTNSIKNSHGTQYRYEIKKRFVNVSERLIMKLTEHFCVYTWKFFATLLYTVNLFYVENHADRHPSPPPLSQEQQ